MSGYKLELKFREEKQSLMLDITSLFYDLELLHDLSVLVSEEEYKDFHFSQNFWHMNGRPIKDYHRLKVARIIKNSPLILEVVIPSLGAIWVLLQIIEKIRNWDLNREKLELEVKKLRRDEEMNRHKLIDFAGEQLQHHLWDIGAIEIQDRIVNRLSDNPNILENIEITPNNEPNIEPDEGPINNEPSPSSPAMA